VALQNSGDFLPREEGVKEKEKSEGTNAKKSKTEVVLGPRQFRTGEPSEKSGEHTSTRVRQNTWEINRRFLRWE